MVIPAPLKIGFTVFIKILNCLILMTFGKKYFVQFKRLHYFTTKVTRLEHCFLSKFVCKKNRKDNVVSLCFPSTFFIGILLWGIKINRLQNNIFNYFPEKWKNLDFWFQP